ncbi:arylsulfatase A-like enzyme [Actinoplanes octamycinicus]|uniref:Arylsulfatase A-like enzyme n=1 Tax=Actinoplanes octamycinicus TaxID=135948 RepID=A0A7W7MBL4_9ACTN|nr:sulfatase [Actinoplanes octamycinicus]MBB4744167.1 arylsulfatase A-like enzyme [Actinoplanes octamycinicus]GIE56877.1 sulfatase [Actinoplanes octamycinicus]
MPPRPHRILGRLAAVLVLLAPAGCTTVATPAARPSPSPSRAAVGAAPSPPGTASAVRRKPNIVFVLTDDLSTDLVSYMPSVLALQRDGVTFTDYTVTDSLCCPSRASILSGKYPHNTGIVKNNGTDGGFKLFHRRGEENATLATDLKSAGYRTAFYGKYLNEYWPRATFNGGKSFYVPPGWDDWAVGGSAYQGFDYELNENGKVRRYGTAPRDYLTDVLSAKAQRFITASAAAGKPFLVEVSTFTPHLPYTPAPRDEQSFPGLTAPRSPAWDTVPVDAPRWLIDHSPMPAWEKRMIDTSFRKRVQSVQAIDRMLAGLRATLTAAGVAGDTLVVFSSDNGYHMGEHRLNPGKMTAFETDIRVPLIAAGPGVKPGHVVEAPAENVDLRPTFAELAGLPANPQIDGRSLVPLLAGTLPHQWRTTALIEHSDPATDPKDPDYNRYSENIPPSYDALRTTAFTYVEYVDGSREYYDLRSDPHQTVNLASGLDPERRTELHEALHALNTCAGARSCWAADRLLGERPSR